MLILARRRLSCTAHWIIITCATSLSMPWRSWLKGVPLVKFKFVGAADFGAGKLSPADQPSCSHGAGSLHRLCSLQSKWPASSLEADIGIVPYEESSGTHCAFVAKIVEYLAVGLPVVSTPLNSARRYFKDEPMVRFSEFNGQSFGEKILSWLSEPHRAVGRASPASQRPRPARTGLAGHLPQSS